MLTRGAQPAFHLGKPVGDIIRREFCQEGGCALSSEVAVARRRLVDPR